MDSNGLSYVPAYRVKLRLNEAIVVDPNAACQKDGNIKVALRLFVFGT
jgi:hypothetical protein